MAICILRIISRTLFRPAVYSSCPSRISRTLPEVSLSSIYLISAGFTSCAFRPACCSIMIYSVGLLSFTFPKATHKIKSNFSISFTVPSPQLMARCFMAVDLPTGARMPFSRTYTIHNTHKSQKHKPLIQNQFLSLLTLTLILKLDLDMVKMY